MKCNDTNCNSQLIASSRVADVLEKRIPCPAFRSCNSRSKQSLPRLTDPISTGAVHGARETVDGETVAGCRRKRNCIGGESGLHRTYRRKRAAPIGVGMMPSADVNDDGTLRLIQFNGCWLILHKRAQIGIQVANQSRRFGARRRSRHLPSPRAKISRSDSKTPSALHSFFPPLDWDRRCATDRTVPRD